MMALKSPAVDPVASMQAVDNKGLAKIAEEIQSKLKSVIENIDLIEENRHS